MNFNRPKVTRRRRRKGATTYLYDFITLFSFCKVRLHSFFALFLRFLPPFPPPGNDVGGRTQNRDGRRTRQRKTSCFFVGFRGKRDRLPFPLCKRGRRATVFSRERPFSIPSLQTRPRIDRTSPPSNNVQKRETPRRLPRNGFYLTSGFYRTFGLGFSRREPAPGDPLLRFRRYSAARTMRSGYTLLVRSVDPSGQIMSRTYPSSPNVTGISTVRVS